MSTDPVVEQEVELKYLLDKPVDVLSFAALGGLGVSAEFELNALYFDTPDLALTGMGISLRRRSGGEDAGWHLKAPSQDQAGKLETRAPITGARPPSVLRDALVAAAGEQFSTQALVPVARLRTIRSQTPLLDTQGNLLAKICFDQVWSQVPPTSRFDGKWGEPTWTELEVELVSRSEQSIGKISELLLELGLTQAPYGSKVESALRRADVIVSESARASEAGSIWEYCASQIGLIQALEDSVGQGDEEAIHRTRVAARRLKSTVSTFAPLFDPALSLPLVDQLRWLGSVLGEARDAQVLYGHLLANLIPQGVIADGGLGEALRPALQRHQHKAVAHMRDLLDTPHYEIMHDTLAEFASANSRKFTLGIQDGNALSCLAKPIGRCASKLLEVTSLQTPAGSSTAVFRQWHSLRKTAKRVRYGFEALVPVYAQARGRVLAWEEVTTTLGALQDAVVAADFLSGIKSSRQPSPLGIEDLIDLEDKQCQDLVGRAPELVRDAVSLTVIGQE